MYKEYSIDELYGISDTAYSIKLKQHRLDCSLLEATILKYRVDIDLLRFRLHELTEVYHGRMDKDATKYPIPADWSLSDYEEAIRIIRDKILSKRTSLARYETL